MTKEKKTYRLSDRAIRIIENRDRSKYPTANDFVEGKIVESEKETEDAVILDEVKKIQKNDVVIMEMLRGLIEKSEDHSLPMV